MTPDASRHRHLSFAIRPNREFERIFDYIAAHGVALVSEDTVAELFDVLSRDKFRKYIPLDQSIDYVEWYAGISEQVIVTEHCRRLPRSERPQISLPRRVGES